MTISKITGLNGNVETFYIANPRPWRTEGLKAVLDGLKENNGEWVNV